MYKLKGDALQAETKNKESDDRNSCLDSITGLVNFEVPLPYREIDGTYDEDGALVPDQGFFSPRSQSSPRSESGSDQLGVPQSDASSTRPTGIITEESLRFESTEGVTECSRVTEWRDTTRTSEEAGSQSPQLSRGYPDEDIPLPPLQPPKSPTHVQAARAGRFRPRVNGAHDGDSH